MSKVCCVYTRCSEDEQTRDGYPLEFQEEKCKEYIEKKGFTYFGTYTDKNISGTVPWDKREGMTQLIQDMKLKKFDTIILHTFDRIGCELTIAYEIIGMCEDYKITILECQRDMSTSTIDGRYCVALSLTFAQRDHFIALERTREMEDWKLQSIKV